MSKYKAPAPRPWWRRAVTWKRLAALAVLGALAWLLFGCANPVVPHPEPGCETGEWADTIVTCGTVPGDSVLAGVTGGIGHE